MNVRWLFAFIFDQQDCFTKSEFALEQTDLMYNVFARVTPPVRMLVFGSHYQKCESGLVEHVFQALLSR